jgi:hypothetical protein
MATDNPNHGRRRKGRQLRKTVKTDEGNQPAVPGEGARIPDAAAERQDIELKYMLEKRANAAISGGASSPNDGEPQKAKKDDTDEESGKESSAMPEEQTRNSSKDSPPPSEQEPLVTEKPVASRRKVSQYVLSVDDTTGSILKMEKLDEKTGQRKEFTQDEYASAYSFGSYLAPYYAAYAASLHDPLNSPAVRAYLQAISEYVKAFTGKP